MTQRSRGLKAWPIPEYCTGSREFARVRESSRRIRDEYATNTRANTREFARIRGEYAKVCKSTRRIRGEYANTRRIRDEYANTREYARVRESSREFARVREQIRISSRMVRGWFASSRADTHKFADDSHSSRMVRRRILVYGSHNVPHYGLLANAVVAQTRPTPQSTLRRRPCRRLPCPRWLPWPRWRPPRMSS